MEIDGLIHSNGEPNAEPMFRCLVYDLVCGGGLRWCDEVKTARDGF